MSFSMSPSPSLQGAAGQAVGKTSSGGGFRDIVPKGYKLGQLGRFSPEQQQLFSQLFGHLSADSPLSKMASGDTSAFQPSEQSAWRDFQSGMGSLASRFSGMGTGGTKSSGFQNAASQSASDFANALREGRHDMQSKALRELFEMSNMLLGQQPTEKGFLEKQQKPPSFLSQLGLSLGGAGSQLGSMFGAKKLGIF